jgi:hypothetical protein
MQVARERIKKCHLSNVQIYLHDARDIVTSGYISGFALGTSLHSCGQLTDIALDLCARSCASFVLSPCCYGQIAKPPPAFEVEDNDLVALGAEEEEGGEGIITTPENRVLAEMQTMSQFHVLLDTIVAPPPAADVNEDSGESDQKSQSRQITHPFQGLAAPSSPQSPFQSIISGADFANNFDEKDARSGRGGHGSITTALSESFLLAKRCMRLVDMDRCLHFLRRARHLCGASYQCRLTSLFPLSCSPKNNVVVGRFLCGRVGVDI